MTEESKDCLECRLISGFGLIGIGAYIYYQAGRRRNWENYTMKILSVGTCIAGGARLSNLSLFRSKRE